MLIIMRLLIISRNGSQVNSYKRNIKLAKLYLVEREISAGSAASTLRVFSFAARLFLLPCEK